jgi:hypothetical protein
VVDSLGSATASAHQADCHGDLCCDLRPGAHLLFPAAVGEHWRASGDQVTDDPKRNVDDLLIDIANVIDWYKMQARPVPQYVLDAKAALDKQKAISLGRKPGAC